MMDDASRVAAAAGLVVALMAAAGCTPTVRVVAPSEPIEINLNVRIDQEIRVRMDREIEELIDGNPDLF